MLSSGTVVAQATNAGGRKGSCRQELSPVSMCSLAKNHTIPAGFMLPGAP
jgi:hypothetical protein